MLRANSIMNTFSGLCYGRGHQPHHQKVHLPLITFCTYKYLYKFIFFYYYFANILYPWMILIDEGIKHTQSKTNA